MSKAYDLLIKGADIVTPGGVLRADIRVKDGIIDAIGKNLSKIDEPVIDAGGLFVLPGIIDCHTHFSLETGKMSTKDDFESGSLSAAAGGVTTYINFAPQKKGQNLLEALNAEKQKAEGHTVVDFSLHLSFGTPPDDWITQLDYVVANGVTSMKVYTTYKDTIYYTTDWDWLNLLRVSGSKGVLVQVHAENDDIISGKTAELLSKELKAFRYHGVSRPKEAEIEAVARAVTFAHLTGSPVYLVHLSCPESIELAYAAKKEGLCVYAEVCPHHISLDASEYQGPTPERFVMTPPLRDASDVKKLHKLIQEGKVDSIGSDHCGYTLEQRGDGMDFTQASPGIPGVETLLNVVYTVLTKECGLSLEEAISYITWRPARIYGLDHRKGNIQVGLDGDFVLFDPGYSYILDEKTLHSAAQYSPWHGKKLYGRVVKTICRGHVVYDEGKFNIEFSHGEFIKRRAHQIRMQK